MVKYAYQNQKDIFSDISWKDQTEDGKLLRLMLENFPDGRWKGSQFLSKHYLSFF